MDEEKKPTEDQIEIARITGKGHMRRLQQEKRRLQQEKEERRKRKQELREELELKRAKLVELVKKGSSEEERAKLAEEIEKLEREFHPPRRRGPRLYRGVSRA